MTQYAVSTFLFDCPNLDISLKAKTVMSYLTFRSNKQNTCFPALKTIAQGCSLSLSSVKRAIKELLGLNLVRKNKRYREDGGQTSNLYTILADELPSTENVRKKRISPKLSNSHEDTTNTNILIDSDYTPELPVNATDKEIISQSFFPCCQTEESQSVENDNVKQDIQVNYISTGQRLLEITNNQDGMMKAAIGKRIMYTPKQQLKRIFLRYINRLMITFGIERLMQPHAIKNITGRTDLSTILRLESSYVI